MVQPSHKSLEMFMVGNLCIFHFAISSKDPGIVIGLSLTSTASMGIIYLSHLRNSATSHVTSVLQFQ